MDNLPDDQSSYANAMVWVSRITSIVMEMVLPGVIGYWIDLRLGTKVVFLILGVILGFVGGIWQLIKLTKHNIGLKKICRELYPDKAFSFAQLHW